MLADAAAEAQRIRERARAEGHAEGRALGRTTASPRRAPPRSALAEALHAAPVAARASSPTAIERDAVELALALAAQDPRGRASRSQPERVLDVVRGRAAPRRRPPPHDGARRTPPTSSSSSRRDRRARRPGRRHRALRGPGRPPGRPRRGDRAHRRERGRRERADPAGARPRGRSRPSSAAGRPKRAARATTARCPVIEATVSRTRCCRRDAAAPGGSAALSADLARCHGRVSNLIGLVIEATGLQAEVGEVCLVSTAERRSVGERAPVPAEVVGFRAGRTLLMPLGELHGIGPGTRVLGTGAPFRVPVGEGLLGRVIDGLGSPLDGPATARAAEPARADGCARRSPLRRARCDGPRISERVGARGARARRPRALRPRPAPGHLRRLGRRQVLAAGHDRPRDERASST